jgi:uncharacterized RDD family membrane protein YckC
MDFIPRVWRGQVEAAVEHLVTAPEVARILDSALAGPLPEQLAHSLARRRVAERVVHELAESGELDRLVEAALASPRTLEVVDRVLASEAMGHVLERVLTGPEARAAVAAQSAGFADQVLDGVRGAAAELDRKAAVGTSTMVFAGLASRGIALVVDALAIAGISVTIGAAAGFVGELVGGVHPQWLAQTLLSVTGAAIAVGYFSLFWRAVGQTPGMRLMHVRVFTSRLDRRLSLGRALVRTLGLALAILPCFLGFLPALFDPRRRALPDYLAGTVVVYDDET